MVPIFHPSQGFREGVRRCWLSQLKYGKGEMRLVCPVALTPVGLTPQLHCASCYGEVKSHGPVLALFICTAAQIEHISPGAIMRMKSGIRRLWHKVRAAALMVHVIVGLRRSFFPALRTTKSQTEHTIASASWGLLCRLGCQPQYTDKDQ